MPVSSVAQHGEPSDIGSAPSVLIVDDNPSDIDLVRIAFDMCHIPVRLDVVGHSDHAVIRLHQAVSSGRCPDLIILDVHMPRMDGYEVIEAMKGDGLIDHIPVVMLSSAYQTSEEQRCIHAGAQAFYRKPDNLEALVSLAEHLAAFLKHDKP